MGRGPGDASEGSGGHAGCGAEDSSSSPHRMAASTSSAMPCGGSLSQPSACLSAQAGGLQHQQCWCPCIPRPSAGPGEGSGADRYLSEAELREMIINVDGQAGE